MKKSNPPQKPGTVRTPTNVFSDDEGESIDDVLVGGAALYQLGFSGSPLTPIGRQVIKMGNVSIQQTLGPFQFQYTDVVTSDDEIPFEGEFTRRHWSRENQFVTVAHTEFTVSGERLDQQIGSARSLCESALGAVSAYLDERFLDRRLGELVQVQTSHGLAYVDITHGVRSFAPGVANIELDELTDRADVISGDPVLQSALKFYMRAMENRVSEVGFVLLASTADMLAGGSYRFKPHDLLAAMQAAGASDGWTLGRMKKVSRTRGELIHRGLVPSAEMYESWYDLEEIVRVLLRRKMKVRSTWDARVPMYDGPIRAFETVYDEDPYPEWASQSQ